MTISDKIKSSINSYISRNHIDRLDIKAALIDMDGVLYDSMKYHTLAWHKMMSEVGIECSREEFYLYEGMTGKATINLLFQRKYGRIAGEEEWRKLYEKKAEYFVEIGKKEVMPGANAMLQNLIDCGIDRVLVTGSAQNSLIKYIDSDFPGAFEPQKRITALDVTKGKPDPEPYLKGLEKAGVSHTNAIVIENAPLGVKSASDAGAFTIAVTTGPIPQEAMVEAGAAFVFSSMEECTENIHLLIYELLTTSLKS